MGFALPRLGVGAAVVLVAGVLAAPPARAQMAVFDSSNFANTSQNLARTIDLLNSANQQLRYVTSLSNTIGPMGAAANLSGLGSPLRNLNGALSMSPVNFSGWNLPKDLSQPNLSTFASARDFVGQTLVPQPDKNQTIGWSGYDAAQQRRSLAFRDAALNGYSLAISERQQVQKSLERVAGLADQATNAATLMDQARATNNLLAAIAGELVAQRSMMTALLEITAAQAIATSPVVFNGTPSTAAFIGAGAQQSGPLGE